jgi:hypothetical protein
MERRLLNGHFVLIFTVTDTVRNGPWVCITVGPTGSLAVRLMPSNIKIYRKLTD